MIRNLYKVSDTESYENKYLFKLKSVFTMILVHYCDVIIFGDTYSYIIMSILLQLIIFVMKNISPCPINNCIQNVLLCKIVVNY